MAVRCSHRMRQASAVRPRIDLLMAAQSSGCLEHKKKERVVFDNRNGINIQANILTQTNETANETSESRQTDTRHSLVRINEISN